MMQDVGHREVVPEGRHHQCNRGHGHSGPARDPRTPCGLGQSVIVAIERQPAGEERVRRERKCQKKRETAYLCHEIGITCMAWVRIESVSRRPRRMRLFYSLFADRCYFELSNSRIAS